MDFFAWISPYSASSYCFLPTGWSPHADPPTQQWITRNGWVFLPRVENSGIPTELHVRTNSLNN